MSTISTSGPNLSPPHPVNLPPAASSATAVSPAGATADPGTALSEGLALTEAATNQKPVPSEAYRDPDQTGVKIAAFELLTYEQGQAVPAPIPSALEAAVVDGKLDLTRITPEMFMELSPQEQAEFLELLGQQPSLGVQTRIECEAAPYLSDFPPDKALLVHLLAQDQSGELAAHLFKDHPTAIVRLHQLLSSTPEMADQLALSLFSNLDETFNDVELDKAHSQALAAMAARYMQSHSQDPEAARAIMEAAGQSGEGLSGEPGDFNAGVLLASLLAGIRDAGVDGLGSLLGGPPSKFSLSGLLKCALENYLVSQADTTDEAHANYNELIEQVLEAFDSPEVSKDTVTGFTHGWHYNENL